MGPDKKELEGAGHENKSPKTPEGYRPTCVGGWLGSWLVVGLWDWGNAPTGRKLLFRGPRAGIFQNDEEWDLTYLHSNLFAYKHKTTFVSQKTRSSRKNWRGDWWAQGAWQWAWHMLKAIPGERHSLNLIIFTFIEAK